MSWIRLANVEDFKNLLNQAAEQLKVLSEQRLTAPSIYWLIGQANKKGPRFLKSELGDAGKKRLKASFSIDWPGLVAWGREAGVLDQELARLLSGFKAWSAPILTSMEMTEVANKTKIEQGMERGSGTREMETGMAPEVLPAEPAPSEAPTTPSTLQERKDALLEKVFQRFKTKGESLSSLPAELREELNKEFKPEEVKRILDDPRNIQRIYEQIEERKDRLHQIELERRGPEEKQVTVTPEEAKKMLDDPAYAKTVIDRLEQEEQAIEDARPPKVKRRDVTEQVGRKPRGEALPEGKEEAPQDLESWEQELDQPERLEMGGSADPDEYKKDVTGLIDENEIGQAIEEATRSINNPKQVTVKIKVKR